MGNLKEIFFVQLFVILDCKTIIIYFINLGGVEWTRNSHISLVLMWEVSWLLVPVIPTCMFIIMFTFVVFSRQLTLPFPSSWNKDVYLVRELFGLYSSLYNTYKYGNHTNWGHVYSRTCCIVGLSRYILWNYKKFIQYWNNLGKKFLFNVT